MTTFFSLPLVLRWTVVGATLPSAIWAAVCVVGVFVEGLEWAVQATGFLIMTAIITAVPGAVVGLALGCVHLDLVRRVERHRHLTRAKADAATDA